MTHCSGFSYCRCKPPSAGGSLCSLTRPITVNVGLLENITQNLGKNAWGPAKAMHTAFKKFGGRPAEIQLSVLSVVGLQKSLHQQDRDAAEIAKMRKVLGRGIGLKPQKYYRRRRPWQTVMQRWCRIVVSSHQATHALLDEESQKKPWWGSP